MLRSVLLGVVLAGVLAGCSLGGGSGAGGGSTLSVPLGGSPTVVTHHATVEGRVFTTTCGGPGGSPCPLRVCRGSLEFCKKNVIGPCSLRDATTCLLCLEQDHHVCHRSVIVEAVGAELPDLHVVNL
jgi:hypothetical protein